MTWSGTWTTRFTLDDETRYSVRVPFCVDDGGSGAEFMSHQYEAAKLKPIGNDSDILR